MESEIKILIHDAILNGFDLSYANKFVELQTKYKDDAQLQKECAFWIAVVYAENNLPDEAVDIFIELIEAKDNLPEHFPNILIHTLQLLTKLHRLEEAHHLFITHIFDKELTPFLYTLGLLSWYVETFEPSDFELAKYEDLLDSAMDKLGFHSNEAELSRKIMHVTRVNSTTNIEYSTLLISLKGKLKNEKVQVLNEFIDSKPPDFYKRLAQEVLSSIQVT